MGSFQTLVSRDDISEQLSRIAVPALVVHGDSDAAISLDRARDMATRLPRAEWVVVPGAGHAANLTRSEEHTSELQSLMRISYAVFCLKKKTHNKKTHIKP